MDYATRRSDDAGQRDAGLRRHADRRHQTVRLSAPNKALQPKGSLSMLGLRTHQNSSIIYLMRIDCWRMHAGWASEPPCATVQSTSIPAGTPYMQPSRDISRLVEIMARLRDPRRRLPVGPGAGFLDHPPLHDRGSLRGRRRDRARGLRRPARGARRPAAAAGLSRADGVRGGPVRHRRRGLGDHRRS